MDDIHADTATRNGLLDRRQLLRAGLLAGLGTMAGRSLAAPTGTTIPAWSRSPGDAISEYGARSPHSTDIQRTLTATTPLYPGGGASFTPLHRLQGTVTPNSLHFERHHAGVPAIDPALHRLFIHGLVKRPLSFSYADLLGYPMVSRLCFIECSGNSRALTRAQPAAETVQALHGLLSCAEWTGIPLSALLEEAGVNDEASWLLAVGADAASMGRSLPLPKVLDDVLLALYQNGEPLRPEQGFPMRLLVPGWEGNTHVKWVTQLKLAAAPAQFRDETSKYTDLLPSGRARQFTFPMGVKSVITSPSGGMQLTRQGLHAVTGLAWSGSGSITRVELSANGGASWADAEIVSERHPQAPVRFFGAWAWRGQPGLLLSRASDDHGNVQPTRNEWLARDGVHSNYHYHGTQCWGVAQDGRVRNAYA